MDNILSLLTEREILKKDIENVSRQTAIIINGRISEIDKIVADAIQESVNTNQAKEFLSKIFPQTKNKGLFMVL